MEINSLGEFKNFANELCNKRHPILPGKISIQLQNKNGENLRTENILCHLNIYIDLWSYYTYSFIPSNSNGTIILTKEQLIQNTELKHSFDEKLPLDSTPVKFDFFVMDTNMINGIISSMEHYLSIDIKFIKAGLKKQGLTDEQIAFQIPMIEEKMESDQQLYLFLKKNKNAELENKNRELKLTGFWENESDYNYELK